MGPASPIRVSDLRDVIEAARIEAADLELDEEGTRALVTRTLMRARPELDEAQAERLYRIDIGHDVPDDPDEVEQIAIELVQAVGTWAPEIPEMYAELARERGETEVAVRQESLLARILALLAKDATRDE